MNKLSAYRSFFNEVINTINSARYQAYKSLNKFHIGQNFEIGRIIVENQERINGDNQLLIPCQKTLISKLMEQKDIHLKTFGG